MKRLRALAIVLSFALFTRANAQDPDCKFAENYGRCMQAKGAGEIGGTKSTPAPSGLTPREAAERAQRRFVDSLHADSVFRANNTFTYRAPEVDKAAVLAARKKRVRQLDEEFQPVFARVDVPEYQRHLLALASSSRFSTGLLTNDVDSVSWSVYTEDPQFWSPVFVRMGIAYFELAEAYGYAYPPHADAELDNPWVPSRYMDLAAYWLSKADSLGNPHATDVVRQLLDESDVVWVTDPYPMPAPSHWRPGRIPVNSAWLSASMRIQSGPLKAMASGGQPPLRAHIYYLRGRHVQVAAFAMDNYVKWMRDSAAFVTAEAARAKAGIADAAAASERAAARAREYAASLAGEPARRAKAESIARAADLALKTTDRTNADWILAADKKSWDQENAELILFQHVVASDSARAARREWYPRASAQLSKLGVTNISRLPEGKHAKLIARALNLSKTRAAAEGIRFDPASPPSPEEAREIIDLKSIAMTSAVEFLSNSLLWSGNEGGYGFASDGRKNALATQPNWYLDDCTEKQPTHCTPQATWYITNSKYGLFGRGSRPFARRFGELACRQEPTQLLCRYVADQELMLGHSQAKALGEMALACASEPTDPLSTEFSDCWRVALCLVNGDCGAPEAELAAGFLRLGCAHRARSSCGEDPYVAITRQMQKDAER